MSEQKSYKKVYLAWLAVALFFFYQYILRISVGVMEGELRSAFKMTAEQFATLGSYYLYAYALLQIPLGYVVDRIGVRKTVLASIATCLAAIFLLSNAKELLDVQLSRVLLGVGSACAYMSGLKIAADYLPRGGKRGLLMGLTLTVGTLGVSVGSFPLVYLLDNFDWRIAVQWLAVPGVVLMALVMILIPRKMQAANVHEASSDPDLGDDKMTFKHIVKITMYAILAIGAYTPLATMADLWGPVFLMKKYEFTRSYATAINTVLYVGLSLGSFIVPWLADRSGRLNRSLLFSAFAVFGLFSFVIFGPVLSSMQLMIVMAVLGFVCGAEVSCFTGASRYTNASNSGLILGFVNTLNMLGGAILQYFIGARLDTVWSGAVDVDQVRVYSAAEYADALTLLVIVLGVCAIVSLFLGSDKAKDSKNEIRNEEEVVVPAN